MRALRLCGLTLAVVAAHLIAWRIAGGGWALPTPARAGVRWISMALAMQRRVVPPSAPATPAAPPATFDRRVSTGPPSEPAPAPGDEARVASTSHPHASIVRSGDGGRAHHGDATAPMQSVYPTHPPPSASLRYVLVSGDAHAGAAPSGSARLDWARDTTSFSLRVVLEPAHAAAREWVSAGGFDAAGVAPTRLAERERGRDKRAINFDRAGGEVRFSGATQAQPLVPGTQDRWSWVAQLAAIAESAATSMDGRGRRRAASASAAPRGIRVGTTWAIEVAGLRGELQRWIFRVLPDTDLPAEAGPRRNGPSATGGREPALLHVLREPERPYDLRVEAWLSPALHYLPVGLRMSTPPGGWSISLWPPLTGDTVGKAPADP